MSFFSMRFTVELVLGLHFLIRCRVAYHSWLWFLVLLLGVSPMLAAPRLGWTATAWHAAIWPYWAGFLVFFTAAVLLTDLVRISAFLIDLASGVHLRKLLSASRAVTLSLLLAWTALGYAYYQAHHPTLTHLVFQTDKLPTGSPPVRLIQLTDVHLNSLIGHDQFAEVVELIRRAEPDLLAVTGDLVDMDMSGRTADAALLAELKPPLGAYAVMGNHESYRGLSNSEKFMRRAGLEILRGQAVSAGGLIVAGVDDEAIIGRASPVARNTLAPYRDNGRPVILLKHRPGLAPDTTGLFDLQLSGHTHGGQIWPGHFIVKKANGVLSGIKPDPSGRGFLYISRGTGYWGLPLRFLAPPEVTLIEVKPGPPGQGNRLWKL